MDLVTLIAVGMFVLLGAAMQRVTGMGFALMASPLLVLALGPLVGVQVALVLGLSTSAIVLVQVWRAVEWRKAAGLLVPAFVGIVAGTWISGMLDPAVLSILVGGLVLAALIATVASERARVFRGTGGLLSAGFLSGFMNVTAGVGGPAIVLYALSTRWAHAAFVATLQFYFVVLGAGSVAARGLPQLDLPTWIVVGSALIVGLIVGQLLAGRVSVVVARRLMVVVALAGSVATIAKGVLALG